LFKKDKTEENKMEFLSKGNKAIKIRHRKAERSVGIRPLYIKAAENHKTAT
jgi:hypothetical protein